MSAILAESNWQTLTQENIDLSTLIFNATYKNRIAIQHRDDAIQSGLIGLIKAAKKYDPSRGVPFRKFATTYVLGHIKDYYRSLLVGAKSLHKQGLRVKEFSSFSSENDYFDVAVSHDSPDFDKEFYELVSDLIANSEYTSKYKSIAHMRYVLGMHYTDIGKEFNLSSARVYQILEETFRYAVQELAKRVSYGR